MFQSKSIKFDEVKVLNPNVYTDYRGDLWTIWKKNDFVNNLEFNHDKISTSRKDVIRGIHGDFKSWKLVSCLYGEIYFVIVDNRPDSKNYKAWDWIMLNDKNRSSILIPPGFGNGFCVMSNNSVFHYKWSYPGKYPDVKDQFTIKWNDKNLAIDWPITRPILQPRDK